MSTTYTLTPGSYFIGDCSVVTDEYYDQFLLPAFEDLDRGESVQAGSSVILCTGADGLYGVNDATTNEDLGSFGVDAANVAIVPAKMVRALKDGLAVTLTEPTTVVCYYDSMVIGGRYRVRI